MSHVDVKQGRTRWWLVWLVSFAVWTLLGFYYTILHYKWQRDLGLPGSFRSILFLALLNFWIAAACSPAIFWLVRRFPIDPKNWRSRVPFHIGGSLLFTIVHVTARLAAYPMQDELGHIVPLNLQSVWRLFLLFSFDDAVMTYFPILVLVQMLVFHAKWRKRELQAVELQTELVRAQLHSLKIQLQPHFLFNTLNSISALMHIDVKAADRMISELSDLLRLSLENRDLQESTVRQELDFVQGYLRIEQTRFSDRLTVVFGIDPETYDAKLPHMLIQPLAENAIRHGIAKRSLGGRIEIASRRRGNQLVISIVDNGPGFDLASLPAARSGVGLKNTRERLRKLYGDEQQLITLPATSGGVEVRVCLPFAAAPEIELADNYSLVMKGTPYAHPHRHC